MYSTFAFHFEQYSVDPYRRYSTEDPIFISALERMAHLHYPYFSHVEKDKRVKSSLDVMMLYRDKLVKIIEQMFRKYYDQHQKRMRENHSKVQKEISRLWREEWSDLI